MAWENRSGKLYFYLKVRRGRRVLSEYWGRGERAEEFAKLMQRDVMGDVIRRDVEQSARADEEKLAHQLLAMERTIDRLLAEILQAAGLHEHKGQWRRRR
ncbi:MAG TPA: hypothetical protein PKE12_02040 [Kiritimatiellia bacterium]|nr:hypothetical protein [Kiritimatiellia bacterium]